MTVRILLLQARNDNDPAIEEERKSFASRADLPLSAIDAHDLLNGPPDMETLSRYTALMVGGSGEYDVSKRNLPQLLKTLHFLRELVGIGFPTFASCFGYQLLVVALGGTIVNDPEQMEVGTYQITLNEWGKKDELFRMLPPTFPAQFGHKERAQLLPEDALNLASSELCAYQALRVPGKPIWATQFHPELTGTENRKRFEQYAKVYAGVMGEDAYEQQLALFQPSIETERLIPDFLDLVNG